eukprot:CAMPEP_0197912168 /NCGR_PEP_ID=MMETSP1439-20131203/74259_1 /TAXON_ID=66791 /ORGANISM="Gonyaulax spinifera, Strain CCMP409" /LENGTH=37 /DNA_ID= /DNA_START= /DNA_END= /DNA_ORIENTATION=
MQGACTLGGDSDELRQCAKAAADDATPTVHASPGLGG